MLAFIIRNSSAWLGCKVQNHTAIEWELNDGNAYFFTFSILLHSAFGQIWLTREEVDKRRVLNGKANLETFRNFAKANYQSVTGCWTREIVFRETLDEERESSQKYLHKI